jgi:hypothetical protein
VASITTRLTPALTGGTGLSRSCPASAIVDRSITVIDHVGPLAGGAARTDLTNFARTHVAATVDHDAKRLVSGHIPGPGTHAPRSAGPC